MSFSPEFKKQLVEIGGIKINAELADQFLGIKKQLFETLSNCNGQLTKERFERVFEVVLSKCNKEEILKSNKTGLVRAIVEELEKERAYPDSNYKKPTKEEDKRAETVRIRQAKEKYPYPYPDKLQVDKEKDKAKESIIPKITNGVIMLDDFLRYVQHVAEYKKMPFDYKKIRHLLSTSGRFKALFKDQMLGLLNPICMSIVEEIIHSSK